MQGGQQGSLHCVVSHSLLNQHGADTLIPHAGRHMICDGPHGLLV